MGLLALCFEGVNHLGSQFPTSGVGEFAGAALVGFSVSEPLLLEPDGNAEGGGLIFGSVIEGRYPDFIIGKGFHDKGFGGGLRV